jgi:segregation and condensation protein B
MEDLKNIVESLLFVADEPLSLERLKKIVEPAEAQEIRQALAALQADHEQRLGAFFLAEVAGGYQFRSRPAYTPWIRRLVDPKPLRLSKAAMETLAIIAYKQPVIRADVEHIRGVDCGGVMRQLLERKLVRVLGRKEIAGRPLIYATTKKFLETFDLKDLKDLPSPREIEEFGRAPLELRGAVTIEPDEATAAEPLEPPAETPSGFPPQAEVDAAPVQPAEEDAGPEGTAPEKTLDFDPETT